MLPQFKAKLLSDKLTITADSENCDYNQLQQDIKNYSDFVQTLQPTVAQCTLPILVKPLLALHYKWDKIPRFKEDTKIELLSAFHKLLGKTSIDNEFGFHMLFDILLSLLNETTKKNIVYSEEYKLALLKCLQKLFTSMDSDLFLAFYMEKQTAKLSQLLYSCLNIIRNERSRELRLNSLELLMKVSRVDDKSDLSDAVLLSQIASIFKKFLPGIVACLIVTAVDDTKCGHKIITTSVKALGRFVSVFLMNYNPLENVSKLEDLFTKQCVDYNNLKMEETEENVYDKKLTLCANFLMTLTAYDHPDVRRQLAESCKLLTTTCFIILPGTIPKLIEILIVLSQDTDSQASSTASEALQDLVTKLSSDNSQTMEIKGIVDSLHLCFQQQLTRMPRVFNGVNEGEQLTAMRLLTGYLKLFSECSRMKSVFFKEETLNKLIHCLLYVVRVDPKDVCLLEEYTLHDWEQTPDSRTPWKRFEFDDIRIQNSVISACSYLSRPIISDIILDNLLEVYNNDCNEKLEALILINEIVAANHHRTLQERRKEVINVYLESSNWNLAVTVNNTTASNLNLKAIHKNIIQLCLQLEGIGGIALSTGPSFQQHLFKTFYIILEKAGSQHPLLQAAGLSCIANICKACRFASITDMINKNADYFAYNVTNKLRRREESANVASVLEVVMMYSTMDVVGSISDVVDGVLMQSCDKFQEDNVVNYLQVFGVFVRRLNKWLGVEVVVEEMISKVEKERRVEVMRTLHWERMSKPVDFSDNIMGKSAEELYREDLEKDEKNEEGDDTGYVKPTPPKHIQLVVKLLERSLNFLPSKNSDCKILVLEILKLGVELLKDYEDELLPIVHKIWSPLVNRFRSIELPLVVNLSFMLLSTLGRLAKDFIRMRSIKEVLPFINDILLKQSKESYLKDRGSAYRYTQGYKMQLVILRELGRFAYDLELDEKISVVLAGVEVYLNSNQPVPLQKAAVSLYQQVVFYDPDHGRSIINAARDKYKGNVDYEKNLNVLCSLLQNSGGDILQEGD